MRIVFAQYGIGLLRQAPGGRVLLTGAGVCVKERSRSAQDEAPADYVCDTTNQDFRPKELRLAGLTSGIV